MDLDPPQCRDFNPRNAVVLASSGTPNEGRSHCDLSNRAARNDETVDTHEPRARNPRKLGRKDEAVVLASAIESSMTDRNREKGGVDRLASRVAKIGNGKTRGLGKHEPMTMTALLEQPRLR
jgi:hypothetical protein